jgi:hypothetical protein
MLGRWVGRREKGGGQGQGVEMTSSIEDTPAHRCVKLYTHLFTPLGAAPQCVCERACE